jgi:polyphosphate kinase
LRRYAHLGTGNYHRKTSLIYTDYGLLTADKTVCADVHKVFQQITGMGKKIHPKLLIHAPFNLRKSTIKMIKLEADAARAGKPARIIAKLNSLTDVAVIKALFSASIAGVQIDLIIRGICCLKPGLPGVSENIRVISVVGRFLEHSRVYYFQNSQPQLYCSSADWMERNLSHRIEVCFPILKKKHGSRVLSDLEAYLDDKVQSWEMRADGHYERLTPHDSAQPDVQTLLLKQLASS